MRSLLPPHAPVTCRGVTDAQDCCSASAPPFQLTQPFPSFIALEARVLDLEPDLPILLTLDHGATRQHVDLIGEHDHRQSPDWNSGSCGLGGSSSMSIVCRSVSGPPGNWTSTRTQNFLSTRFACAVRRTAA